MGEAFDRTGAFLGAVEADSKREVFEKLNLQFKDAHEFRIHSGASVEMPRYVCHKEVWALKIREIVDSHTPGQESDGSRLLIPHESGYGPVLVDAAYMRKHQPLVGGYYVVYKDGYKSWSPAQAFEEGYRRA